MTSLPITSVTAAVAGLLMLPLTVLVSMRRMAVGQARDETLRRRIRAFGNFIEYVPMCLILLGLTELAGAPGGLLWVLAGLLLAGRVIHALGMLFDPTPLARTFGMLMTYAAFSVPAVWLLLNFRN